MTKKHDPEIYRTRLFLITPADYETAAFAKVLTETLKGGDVASLLILPPKDGDYQAAAKTLIPIAQEHEIATLIHNDSQVMGRSGADGLHLDGAVEDIVETVKAHAGREVMGVACAPTRHEAMEMGEGPIDYLFFGRLDGDTKPDIFPKMFKLAEWWCSLFEVPGVVMGGNSLESVEQASKAGIDFVGLRTAIWDASDPKAALNHANQLLDTDFEARKAALDA